MPVARRRRQFEANSEPSNSRIPTVNDLRSQLNGVLGTDNQNIGPRLPRPLRKNAGTARTHVFGKRLFFEQRLVHTRNLYGDSSRRALFESSGWNGPGHDSRTPISRAGALFFFLRAPILLVRCISNWVFTLNFRHPNP